LEHHYCGYQPCCLFTQKLNVPSAFVYFRQYWSWSCYFGLGLRVVSSGLGLKNLVLFTSLISLLSLILVNEDYHQGPSHKEENKNLHRWDQLGIKRS